MQDFDGTKLSELPDEVKECPKCRCKRWVATYYPEMRLPDSVDSFGRPIINRRTIPCWRFTCRRCGHIWDWREKRNAEAAPTK